MVLNNTYTDIAVQRLCSLLSFPTKLININILINPKYRLYIFSADGQIANPDILFYFSGSENVYSDTSVSCIICLCVFYDEIERLNQIIDRTCWPWT